MILGHLSLILQFSLSALSIIVYLKSGIFPIQRIYSFK